MTKYVFTYHGGRGMPETQAEIDAVMAAWGTWFAELGDHLVDGGNPFGAKVALAADGTTTEGGVVADMGGYGIVQADDLDAALVLARGCPVLAGGGTVQVSEAIEM